MVQESGIVMAGHRTLRLRARSPRARWRVRALPESQPPAVPMWGGMSAGGEQCLNRRVP